jgi:hypothetical protein
MSPVIRISDETFSKLQLLATPFVDTPDTVIGRLLDAALANRVDLRPALAANSAPYAPDAAELDPDAPDSLTHTRVRYARFGVRTLSQPNWNKLLRVAHEVALKELGSVAALRQASGAHIKEGQHLTEGFAYMPEAGISIQGLDANSVWIYSLKLARRIGVPVEVAFEWHDKAGAARPGSSGRLKWAPGNGKMHAA